MFWRVAGRPILPRTDLVAQRRWMMSRCQRRIVSGVSGSRSPVAASFGYHAEQCREQGPVCPVQLRTARLPPLKDRVTGGQMQDQDCATGRRFLRAWLPSEKVTAVLGGANGARSEPAREIRPRICQSGTHVIHPWTAPSAGRRDTGLCPPSWAGCGPGLALPRGCRAWTAPWHGCDAWPGLKCGSRPGFPTWARSVIRCC
jgi:hypothetical protein